jgi:hypothetical protein
MKSIWESCDKAEVPEPKEVTEFFQGEDPGDKPGQEISLEAAMKEWNTDYAIGYEIDVTKLPKGLKIIRAYMT